ncbi:hypothetical protein BV898_02710 [Hypsibius exemplaris]|uniref:Uncharacterized protein n=1 Tax=Hypsibius exemplaris TaxID=2072580 RepID=A0A1W0X6U8_HYPEX|nr:hypothetical protein BV898_02710 [Hypsibius exemplaris]
MSYYEGGWVVATTSSTQLNNLVKLGVQCEKVKSARIILAKVAPGTILPPSDLFGSPRLIIYNIVGWTAFNEIDENAVQEDLKKVITTISQECMAKLYSCVAKVHAGVMKRLLEEMEKTKNEIPVD